MLTFFVERGEEILEVYQKWGAEQKLKGHNRREKEGRKKFSKFW